jgi:hypothetical protein
LSLKLTTLVAAIFSPTEFSALAVGFVRRDGSRVSGQIADLPRIVVDYYLPILSSGAMDRRLY